MKLFVSLLILCLAQNSIVYAQSKPPANKKPPTKSQMNDLMKQAEAELNKLTPEQRKMMDSLGITMPSFKDVPDVTDQQLASAHAEDIRLVPSKKAALIAKIPKKVFSDQEMAAYLAKTNTALAAYLQPNNKAAADKILAQFKTDKHYGGMVASSANGLWILGAHELAVYLMGKAAEILPNADNYNNFAAYLTMTGAPQVAIPVLDKLAAIYKTSSTVYNNLGQAWIALGDIDKGQKYLDSAIRIYAYHPQANYTKCIILESQGKKAEAVKALKQSLKHSITKKKLEKLKQLNDKEKTGGYDFHGNNYASTGFNLGNYTAMVPSKYAAGGTMNEELAWRVFRENMDMEGRRLMPEAERAAKAAADYARKKISQKNSMTSPYLLRAQRTAYQPEEEIIRANEKEMLDYHVKYVAAMQVIKDTFESAFSNEQIKFDKRVQNGENVQEDCEGQMPIIAKYVSESNDLNRAYRVFFIKRLTTNAYHAYNLAMRTAESSDMALLQVLGIKAGFIEKLKELPHTYYDRTGCLNEQKKQPEKKKLDDFDKVNCKTASTLYVPMAGQMTLKCNELSVVFNPYLFPVGVSFTQNLNTNVITEASISVSLKGVDINVSGKFDEGGAFQNGNVSVGKNIHGIDVSANGDFDANGFTKGSIELGVDADLDLLPASISESAPLEVSLKNELGMTIEMGPDGIEDISVKQDTKIDVSGSVAADIGKEGNQAIDYINQVTQGENVTIPKPELSVGASVSAGNRISVNSGYSGNVSGELSGFK